MIEFTIKRKEEILDTLAHIMLEISLTQVRLASGYHSNEMGLVQTIEAAKSEIIKRVENLVNEKYKINPSEIKEQSVLKRPWEK